MGHGRTQGRAGGFITLMAPTGVGTHLDRDTVQGERFTGVPVGGGGWAEQQVLAALSSLGGCRGSLGHQARGGE